MSLKERTAKGVMWNGIDSVALNIIRFGTAIVLSRILDPDHFGLIALLAIFIALSETLMSGGFVTALVRKDKVNNIDYSTVFIFNIVFSFLLYASIFFGSPYIASYFEEPELNIIAKLVGLVILFHSFSIVQQITLRRSLNFKSLSIANISSTVLSSFTAIVMAVNGFGVWSLVVQNISKAFFFSVFLWFAGTWK
ncbi:MAG: flippase, partial [Marinilabiliales bacterium]